MLSWFIEFQLWHQKALLTEFEDAGKTHPEDKEGWLEEKILRQTTKVSTQGSTWVSVQTTAEGFRLSLFYWFTFDTLQKESIIKEK